MDNKKHYSVARVESHTRADVSKFERHIERKNESYSNMNVQLERTPYNVYYKRCEITYNEKLDKMVKNNEVSLRGLKSNAKIYDELIFDVNSEYFEEHGGYEFAKEFYEKAYNFACKEMGKEYVISAVMHADEINERLSEELR